MPRFCGKFSCSKFANLERLEGQLHNLVAGVDVDDPNFLGVDELLELCLLLTTHPGKAGFDFSHSAALILLPFVCARAATRVGPRLNKNVAFIYEARNVCKLGVMQH